MANRNPSPSTRFRTGKEQESIARKGGKASAKKRKEYASFRECFNENMDDDKRQELFDMLYKRARQGNLKAFEILRDTMGEKPVEAVSVSKVDQSAIDAVEAFISGKREKEE